MPSRDRLTTVEAARGLAALAVVLFHSNASMAYMKAETFGFLSVGESGVDFFFILSGFIIAFVHGDDIGRPNRALDYVAKRLIRLFPLLWLVVGGWLVLRAAAGKPPNPAAIGTSMLLYPSTIDPVPLVVWTLRHEFLFYSAFLVLLLSKTNGAWLFAAWFAGCIMQLALAYLGRPVTGLTAFFLSSYHLDFMFGMGIAWLHRRVVFRRSLWPLLTGILAVIAILAARKALGGARDAPGDYTSLGATLWTVLLGAAFALLLHGALRWEGVRIPRVFLAVGASSYAMYLIHTPLNSGGQHFAALLPAGASHIAIVVMSVVAGWLLHTFAERPISRILRAKSARWLERYGGRGGPAKPMAAP